MALGKEFGRDKLPAELLKSLLDNDAGVSKFHDTVVDTQRGG